jgi:hypothetical protein
MGSEHRKRTPSSQMPLTITREISMELEDAGATPKRSRSKTKASGAAPRAARSRKARATAPEAIEVTSVTPLTTPSEEQLRQMIATAAYYMAERRNFQPGHELDDWLAAERQIRTLHT